MVRQVLALAFLGGFVGAAEPVALPQGVPPVTGVAAVSGDSNNWAVELAIPRITWEVVGEKRPKAEWSKFDVRVQEARMTLRLRYDRASQLAENSRNRIVDLQGRRLEYAEAAKLLKSRTPVLVSVSGEMPDPYHLQCVKPDTLIVILGIPDAPAPQLLPQPVMR